MSKRKHISLLVFPMAFVFVCVVMNVSAKAGYYVQIFPQPKVLKYKAKPTGLPHTILLKYFGAESSIKQYTLALLADKFRSVLNCTVITKDSQKNSKSSYLTIIVLKIDNKISISSEGYRINLKSKSQGKVHTLFVKSPSAEGLLYGSWRLLDIILESTRQAGRLSVPSGLLIEDVPTMKMRLLPTIVNKIDEISLARLDWLARWGINGIWVSTSASAENIKSISREARKRAITLYGMLSFRYLSREYKRPLCPSDVNDRKIVYKHFEKAAQAGCGGFVFLFDDLGEAALNHYKTCSKCKERLSSLADIQVEFLKIMVDVAKKYHIDDNKLIMCPTPYRAWWLDKYKLSHNYFSVISDSPYIKRVKMFHTDFYHNVIKSLEQIGLKRYVWWNNGLWETNTFYGNVYVGIPRIGLSWNCFERDKVRGIVVLTKAMLELYRLPELTSDVYPSPTGDMGGQALGGLYAWYPQAYCVNEHGARRFVIENLLGVYAYPYYKIWEDIMMAYASPAKQHVSEAVLLGALKLAKSIISQIKRINKTEQSLYSSIADKLLVKAFIKRMEKSTESVLLKCNYRKKE